MILEWQVREVNTEEEIRNNEEPGENALNGTEKTAPAPESEEQAGMDRKTGKKRLIPFDISALLPKNLEEEGRAAYFLACRFLLSALLIGLSYIRSFPALLSLALRITALGAGLWSTVFSAYKERQNKEYLARCLILVICAVVTAAADDFIAAAFAAYVFSALNLALVWYYSTRHGALDEDTENIAEKSEKQGGHDCLAYIQRDVEELHFKEARKVTKLQQLYVLGVIAAAAIVSLVPPLFDSMSFGKWAARAAAFAGTAVLCELTTVCVLACLNGTLTAFRERIFYRSIDVFFKSASISSVVFNKTGIITDSTFKISCVNPVRINTRELLFLAAYAEAYSSHPLARAILEASGITPDGERIDRHSEERGMGSLVLLDGSQIVSAGSIEFMEKLGVKGDFEVSGTTSVYVAVGKTYVGRIDFENEVNPAAAEAVSRLKKRNVSNIAMMTGDNTLSATHAGRQVGISEIYADYRPVDKRERIQYLLETQEPDDVLAYVGDGYHDEELLALADVGVAFGHTDAESDVIISSDDILLVPEMVRIPQVVGSRIRNASLAVAAVDALLAVLCLCGVVPLWGVIIVEALAQYGAGRLAVSRI